MQQTINTLRSHEPSRQQGFVPLELEQRTHVDTACAAYHLGRRPQTMRVWASTEQGPIRPVRVYGRLAWPVDGIRQLLAANKG